VLVVVMVKFPVVFVPALVLLLVVVVMMMMMVTMIILLNLRTAISLVSLIASHFRWVAVAVALKLFMLYKFLVIYILANISFIGLIP
jgi:hypothetical protein